MASNSKPSLGTPARLAVFAAALAFVFLGALSIGKAIGPDREPTTGSHGTEEPEHGDAEAGAEHEAKAQPVRGLAVSDDGLTLDLARKAAPQGEQFTLAFRIVGRDGRVVRDFDVEHTKRMHLIVVRRDATGFQHLHPTASADGTWSVRATLPDAGVYRVFADFSVDDTPRTLAADFTVDGDVQSRPLPAPAAEVTVDGLRVALKDSADRAGAEADLPFTVTRAGREVPVDDYLGAKGHLVALRDGDLAFLHVHPDANSLRFMATFPTAGRYRLFLQFKTEGRLHTAAFTREVSR
ncbi:MAG TPA: hypothetical protein VNT22_02400 [Baekduia sp.]|nr:hypothetical protein [Baekduia sp.]